MAEDVQALVKQLLSDDEPRREQAYFALLEREEDVVPPLIDAFYAGVTEAQGVLLLDLLGAIGGYEALNLLADVLENGEKPGWRERAALGLARNGRTDVLDTVFDWLQDGEATRRQMATLALGYVGGAEASMALVHLLHEDEVAPQAVEALFLRGDVEGLAAGYNTDSARVWQMVTEALLEMGETGPLVDILQNQHPLFHEKVLVSLQNSEHPRAEAVLQAGDEPADGER